MAHKTIALFAIIFILFCNCSYGQGRQLTDSLTKIVIHKKDSSRVNIYNELAVAYQYSNKDSALKYANHALATAKKINYKIGEATALSNIGIIYENFGDYDLALDYSMQAMKIHEDQQNPRGIALCLSSIGNIFYYQNNYSESIKYFEKAISVANEINDKYIIVGLSANIALIHSELGNHERSLQKNLECLKLYEELKLKESDFSILYLNIGENYYNLNELRKSLEYYNKSIVICNQMEDITTKITVLTNISEIYLNQKKYSKALEYCTKAIENAKAAGLKGDLKHSYHTLSKIYYSQGDYQKAYDTHELYVEAKDSLLNKQNQEAIAELQTKYETEQKEKENEILRQEDELKALKITRQNITIYSGAGGLVLIIALLGVIYKGYNEKKKANLLLAKKNGQLNIKNMIIEEKNKNIFDSLQYASNIQQTILPSSDLLHSFFDRHFVFFQPKEVVSGDFYWFHEKKDRLFLMAGDCTGHGVPGAFLSMLCNNILNQVIIEEDENDPGVILSKVNNGVINVLRKEGSMFKANDGMDCALCVFDKSLRKVAFSGAYNPMFVVRDGEMTVYKADKMPIGGRTELNAQFTTHTADLQANDMIYIFSDGYPDQFGGETGKKFMVKNFKLMLQRISISPCEKQLEFVNKTLSEWKKDQGQIDDILIIGIRV